MHHIYLVVFSLLLFGSSLSACVSERAVYDNIQLNECLKKKGEVYCENRKDYETYKKERETLLKKDTSKD